MGESVLLLKISYRVGAVADGFVAAIMPARAYLGTTSTISDYAPETPYRYAMGLAGALMLGWTILLLWADRHPIERRGILLIINIVIIGLIGSGLFAWIKGFIPLSTSAVIISTQAALVCLFSFSYRRSLKDKLQLST